MGCCGGGGTFSGLSDAQCISGITPPTHSNSIAVAAKHPMLTLQPAKIKDLLTVPMVRSVTTSVPKHSAKSIHVAIGTPITGSHSMRHSRVWRIFVTASLLTGLHSRAGVLTKKDARVTIMHAVGQMTALREYLATNHESYWSICGCFE